MKLSYGVATHTTALPHDFIEYDGILNEVHSGK